MKPTRKTMEKLRSTIVDLNRRLEMSEGERVTADDTIRLLRSENESLRTNISVMRGKAFKDWFTQETLDKLERCLRMLNRKAPKLPRDLTIEDMVHICHRHGVRFHPLLTPKTKGKK